MLIWISDDIRVKWDKSQFSTTYETEDAGNQVSAKQTEGQKRDRQKIRQTDKF